jgi:RNA recognition motif-containing protein
MAKRLYVGNLSFQMTDADLNKIFSEVGEVQSAQIITDRDTGRSKGFGFVEMGDDTAATKAIEKFNGKQVNGRTITVNEARQKESVSRGFGGGGRDQGGRGRGGYGRY